jgi:hypothetical protein
LRGVDQQSESSSITDIVAPHRWLRDVTRFRLNGEGARAHRKCYDPDTLKVLYQDDDGRELIAPEVADYSAATYAARMKLAETILGLARDGMRDAQMLTDAAVRAMLSGPTKLRS